MDTTPPASTNISSFNFASFDFASAFTALFPTSPKNNVKGELPRMAAPNMIIGTPIIAPMTVREQRLPNTIKVQPRQAIRQPVSPAKPTTASCVSLVSFFSFRVRQSLVVMMFLTATGFCSDFGVGCSEDLEKDTRAALFFETDSALKFQPQCVPCSANHRLNLMESREDGDWTSD